MPLPKRYDRAYFDHWYRDPRHAIHQHGMLPRRVQLAVSAAEYLLERQIRNVLDVGCGEGRWRAMLRHARPRVRYVGVDSSEYVVRRYGKLRNLRFGRFGDLGRLGLKRRFDLIVCSDVLHYVPTAEARRGLRALARLLGGVAFIEVFTHDDATIGDGEDFQRRRAGSYRRMFREAGLVHLGLHCYAGRMLRDRLTTFDGA
jgi:SAM-dependent methyltransferase